MKTKKLKVLYSTRSRQNQSNYCGSKYIETPKISMEGKWLEALGFHIGDFIQVTCEEGTIHISAISSLHPDAVCEPQVPYKAE